MIVSRPSSVEDWTWVWPGDDALDASADDFASELEAALETGDWQRLPTRDGQQPVLWTLRHLRGEIKRRIIGLHSQGRYADDVAGGAETMLTAIYMAAAVALRSADGLLLENGEPVTLRRTYRRDLKCRAIDDDGMSLLCDIDQGMLVNSMGLAVIAATLPKKKR